MKLRSKLAIRAAKITSYLIKKLNKGNGVTFPGKVALRIDPNILSVLSSMVKKQRIVTMGTNGKTTTNSIIYHALKEEGYNVIINRTGANMLNGIISAFVLATDKQGRINADYACIEVDEMASVAVLPQVNPDVAILTNISRDQLDRFGEVDITFNKLKQAYNSVPKCKLTINGDDILSYSLAKECQNPFITYGISEEIFDNISKSEIRESTFCRVCESKIEYRFFHYGQLGIYKCPKCGFERPVPDYEAKSICYHNQVYSFEMDGMTIESTARTPYNIYNTLSAYALLKNAKIPIPHFKEMAESFDYGNDREVFFDINGTRTQLHLAKNPVGFQQKVSLVLKDDAPKDIIIQINDSYQDGRDISWLWDVDFQYLAKAKANSITLLGTRKYDMALRLKYEDVSFEVKEDMEEVVKERLSQGVKNLYVIVNYTGLYSTNKILNDLKDTGGAR
ncbi:UDP-N-acetylmuramyl tripeptide synthase [Aequitasia blattaphilus]|uniref:Lipid II isoglutaminyl synthase (glutamine-hydrolyzing) subunit MurT n=1 Tax=Aequitasia blattaphilus TaxID=2949332 RepID=A0ABT1EC33_9FIRM|nr:Mur ligase family protein [Aequitasia blattaphilus]MCP1103390.1 MurT ligase domain-containing protein [Aequitasia blattaphilus]MCR8616030.1 MurT ligase domain-containing protein [Aequitasia blattaphilus]